MTTREAALLKSGECRTTLNTYIVGFDDAAHETQIPAAARTRYPHIINQAHMGGRTRKVGAIAEKRTSPMPVSEAGSGCHMDERSNVPGARRY